MAFLYLQHIHQNVQDTVRGRNETSISEKRSLEKNKAGGLSFDIKVIRGLKEITAAKIGDFYGESVPYLSEWTHGECLKKLNLVCQNEHRSEGVTVKRLYSFF